MVAPKEALVGNQPININSQAKASPANQVIGNNDTVTFNNNDPSNSATVSFLGAATNEFSYNGANMPTVTIAAGSSSMALTPNAPNVTANYNVAIGAKNDGPFAIVVGSGRLEIDIVDNSGSTNMPFAEIPNNGSLFFNNTLNYQVTVTFSKPNVLFDSNGNSVTSQVIPATNAGGTLTGRGTNNDVKYTTQVADDRGRVRDGSGTIKIGRT